MKCWCLSFFVQYVVSGSDDFRVYIWKVPTDSEIVKQPPATEDVSGKPGRELEEGRGKREGWGGGGGGGNGVVTRLLVTSLDSTHHCGCG